MFIARIEKVRAREIIDSRGNPTIEADVYLDDGTMVVVENGRRHVGETISVVVSTVLQTSAGRMIFTRAEEAVKTGA